MSASQREATEDELLIGGEPLAQWLAARRQSHKVVGASLGVLHAGATHTAASGLLNLGTGVEATVDSVFQVGSITKLFTATLILQLLEAGRIALDDPVQRYLAEFVVADAEANRNITIRHLLNHTSGMEGDFFPEDDGEGSSAQSYLRKMRLLPQIFAPGQGPMTYCNSGYVVLGRLIEVLRGQPFYQALMQRIGAPLAWRNAFVDPRESLRFRCAMGHLPDPRAADELAPAAVSYLPLSCAAAGTTLSMSVAELLKFAAAWLQQGAGLLRPTTVALVREAAVAVPAFTRRGYNHWALGWMLGDWPQCQVMGHDGTTMGQFAYLRIFPQRNVAFALLTNSPSAAFFEEVEATLMEHLELGHWPADPGPTPGLAVQTEIVGQYENLAAKYLVREQGGLLQLKVIDKVFGSPPLEAPLLPVAVDVYQADSSHHSLQSKLCFLRNKRGQIEFIRAGVRMARRSGEMPGG